MKPKVAIFKLTSCSGCQQVILNCENELLDIVGAVELAHFVEARRQNQPGPYDIGIVEGSVSTPEEVKRIKEIRAECKVLMALGTCAVFGGVQALRNWWSLDQIKRTVYEHPEAVEALAWSTGIDLYVPVDARLPGCAPDKEQLLDCLVGLLADKRPELATHSVCVECKLKGNLCLLVSQQAPCLGPVIRAGCGAACPSYGQACYGCFGPCEEANVAGLERIFESRLGLSREEIRRYFLKISSNAEAFSSFSGKNA